MSLLPTDPYNVSLIENITHTINEQRKTTIVLVTHNVFQAKRLANRVAFLLEGKTIEIAATKEFFRTPVDARTGSFVRGDMVY
jgi:tungstate transport system ATP-binding protein